MAMRGGDDNACGGGDASLIYRSHYRSHDLPIDCTTDLIARLIIEPTNDRPLACICPCFFLLERSPNIIGNLLVHLFAHGATQREPPGQPAEIGCIYLPAPSRAFLRLERTTSIPGDLLVDLFV